jgi:uncharacterized protein (DUF433 family)
VEVGLMETQTFDAKLVYQQLDALLAELHRLRELVKPYVIEKPKRVETVHPHIERVPGVRGGQPVISGTRIPLWIIVDHFKMGRSLDYILENYDLTAEQVYDALSYYYEHTDEIEQAIALNSDQEYWQGWLERKVEA